MTGSRWRICLLDGFGLRDGNEVVELPPASAHLLAFLALRREPVPRPQLAGSLWAGAEEDRAAGNLRSAVWRMPAGLRSAVVRHGERVGLDPGISCDVSELDARLERLSAGTPLESDLDVHGLMGELLPDWYDDWVLAEREVLRLRRVTGLERLADVQLARGRHAHAMDAALAAVAAEPLREAARRRVIEIQLDEGNLAEALREYQRFADLLAEQLGVAPSPRLSALVAHALR